MPNILEIADAKFYGDIFFAVIFFFFLNFVTFLLFTWCKQVENIFINIFGIELYIIYGNNAACRNQDFSVTKKDFLVKKSLPRLRN